MKLKVGNVSQETLYLLELDVDGERVAKIGITGRPKIESRCLEIIESYFKGRRYMPYLKPKRYRKVDDAFVKEQWLLDYLKEYRFYPPNGGFGGSTELVKMDLSLLVALYEKIIEGEEVIIHEWETCPVCGKDKKFIYFEDGKEIRVCGHKCETNDSDKPKKEE